MAQPTLQCALAQHVGRLFVYGLFLLFAPQTFTIGQQHSPFLNPAFWDWAFIVTAAMIYREVD